jgi:hypothetical protein
MSPAACGNDHMLNGRADDLFYTTEKGIQVFRFHEHYAAALSSAMDDVAIVQPDMFTGYDFWDIAFAARFFSHT